MSAFTKREKEVLGRYISGAKVREEDEAILDKYASIGFVSDGFNWDDMVSTAKLTELGLVHLNE